MVVSHLPIPKDLTWFAAGMVITNINTRETFVVVDTKSNIVYLQNVFAPQGTDTVTIAMDGNQIVTQAHWLHENFKIHYEDKYSFPPRPGTAAPQVSVFKPKVFSYQMAIRIDNSAMNVDTLKHILDDKRRWFWGNGKYYVAFNYQTRTVERVLHRHRFLRMFNTTIPIADFLATAY